MKNAENPILSISMLASNRLDMIPRCLDSLTAIREAIPCELIIVDTSKNPAVRKCIEKYTDRIIEFEWCDDFAKARNTGLNECKGKWFMFIDDDEWFIDSEDLIHFFQSEEYRSYGYADYRIRNYKDNEYRFYEESWLPRLTEMNENTQFCGKVHEYLAGRQGERKNLEVLVGHSGYNSVEAKRARVARNAPLLKAMMEKEPDKMNWKIQQLQEYVAIEAWEALEEFSKKTIKEMFQRKYFVSLIEGAEVHLALILALVHQRKYEEAKGVYSKCIKKCSEVLSIRAYMDVQMCEVYYYLHEYEALHECAMDYLECYEKYQKNPEEYEHEFHGNVFTIGFIPVMYLATNTFLLFAKLVLGKHDNLKELYQNILWPTVNRRLIFEVNNRYLDVLIMNKDTEMIKEVMFKVLAEEDIKPFVFLKMIELESTDEKVYQMMLDIFCAGMEENVLEDELCINYYNMVLARKVLSQTASGLQLEQMNDGFMIFSYATIKVYDALYKDQIKRVELAKLPKVYQAALWLKAYFEEVEKDIKAALPYLSKVVEVYPLFQDVIKGYLECLKQEMMQ